MKPYGNRAFPRYDTDEQPNPKFGNSRLEEDEIIAEQLADMDSVMLEFRDIDSFCGDPDCCGVCGNEFCDHCLGG